MSQIVTAEARPIVSFYRTPCDTVCTIWEHFEMLTHYKVELNGLVQTLQLNVDQILRHPQKTPNKNQQFYFISLHYECWSKTSETQYKILVFTSQP